VDDDEALLETTAALLELDFSVHTSRNGPDALRFMEALAVDVVCSDFRMPGMDGVTLLQQAHRKQPQVMGILMTGFREQLPPGARIDSSVFGILYKPYEPEKLVGLIEDAARTAKMNRSVSSFARKTARLGEVR